MRFDFINGWQSLDGITTDSQITIKFYRCIIFSIHFEPGDMLGIALFNFGIQINL